MGRKSYFYPDAVLEGAEDLKACRNEIESLEETIAALTAQRDKRQEHLDTDIRNGANRQHLLAHRRVIEEIEAHIQSLVNQCDRAEALQDVEIQMIAEQAESHCEACLKQRACKTFTRFDASRKALSARLEVA